MGISSQMHPMLNRLEFVLMGNLHIFDDVYNVHFYCVLVFCVLHPENNKVHNVFGKLF